VDCRERKEEREPDRWREECGVTEKTVEEAVTEEWERDLEERNEKRRRGEGEL